MVTFLSHSRSWLIADKRWGRRDQGDSHHSGQEDGGEGIWLTAFGDLTNKTSWSDWQHSQQTQGEEKGDQTDNLHNRQSTEKGDQTDNLHSRQGIEKGDQTDNTRSRQGAEKGDQWHLHSRQGTEKGDQTDRLHSRQGTEKGDQTNRLHSRQGAEKSDTDCCHHGHQQ